MSVEPHPAVAVAGGDHKPARGAVGAVYSFGGGAVVFLVDADKDALHTTQCPWLERERRVS